MEPKKMIFGLGLIIALIAAISIAFISTSTESKETSIISQTVYSGETGFECTEGVCGNCHPNCDNPPVMVCTCSCGSHSCSGEGTVCYKDGHSDGGSPVMSVMMKEQTTWGGLKALFRDGEGSD